MPYDKTTWVNGLGGGTPLNETNFNKIEDALEAVTDTADAAAAAVDLKAPIASPTFTGTVSGITKTMVGLANVDNTSDASKPVSADTQIALDLKANLASPTFTGTVSGISKSMVGLGSVDNTADTAKPVSTAQQTALNLKANLASPTFTGTVAGITKSMVGLGSVDNTADTAKPVSTAQQTALDLKVNALVTTTTQSGTSYTLVLADGGTDIEFTNALAIAVSIPTNASVAFPIGTIITFWPRGGQITTAAASPGTTTVESRGSAFKSAGVNGPMTLKKRATDGWLITGDITT